MEPMELFVLSVFVTSDDPFRGGNPLAVFPESGELTKSQMQAIARTLNFSETAFVSWAREDSYSLRIFTPYEELGFAGHPTIGTAWLLRHLDLVHGDEMTQRSEAGTTQVTASGDVLWLERGGEASADLEDSAPDSVERIADALGLQVSDIELEARELGRPGRLRPAFSDAGLRQLVIPLRDVGALQRCRPRAELLSELSTIGVYCFTAVQAGRLRSRGFFPAVGVQEDPATGSAAAALGLYLAARVGAIDLEIMQGVEMGRPSRLELEAETDRVRVGGRSGLVLRGRLEQTP